MLESTSDLIESVCARTDLIAWDIASRRLGSVYGRLATAAEAYALLRPSRRPTCGDSVIMLVASAQATHVLARVRASAHRSSERPIRESAVRRGPRRLQLGRGKLQAGLAAPQQARGARCGLLRLIPNSHLIRATDLGQAAIVCRHVCSRADSGGCGASGQDLVGCRRGVPGRCRLRGPVRPGAQSCAVSSRAGRLRLSCLDRGDDRRALLYPGVGAGTCARRAAGTCAGRQPAGSRARRRPGPVGAVAGGKVDQREGSGLPVPGRGVPGGRPDPAGAAFLWRAGLPGLVRRRQALAGQVRRRGRRRPVLLLGCGELVRLA